MTPLLLWPDPILTTPCRAIVSCDETRRAFEIMEAARLERGGVGIAAPQIGYRCRLAIVATKSGHLFRMANPNIARRAGSMQSREGCLSLPGAMETACCSGTTYRPGEGRFNSGVWRRPCEN